MSATLQLVKGIGAGYNFSIAKEKEREVKQGKNYYQASLMQVVQISQLSTLLINLSYAIPNSIVQTTTQVAVNVLSVASWPFCPTFAAARQGHFADFMAAVKSVAHIKTRNIAHWLP